MVDIVKLAEAVASEIGEAGTAEVMFAPELDLKGLREMRIIVVPLGLEMKPIARKSSEDEVVDLINTVVTIGKDFLDKKLEGATCLDVKYNPLYSAEHLRERRQFTGVVELHFKAVSGR